MDELVLAVLAGKCSLDAVHAIVRLAEELSSEPAERNMDKSSCIMYVVYTATTRTHTCTYLLRTCACHDDWHPAPRLPQIKNVSLSHYMYIQWRAWAVVGCTSPRRSR